MGKQMRARAHAAAQRWGVRFIKRGAGMACAAALVASLTACSSSDLQAINEVLDGLNEGLSGMPSTPYVSQPSYSVSTPYVSQPSYRVSTPYVSQPPSYRASTPYVSQPSYRVSTPSTNKPSDITW
jgi:hypothetical protein